MRKNRRPKGQRGQKSRASRRIDRYTVSRGGIRL